MPRRDRQLTDAERRAADRAGITWRYTDGTGRSRRAPARSVRAALEVLDGPDSRERDAVGDPHARGAPRRKPDRQRRMLGVFAPVYALRDAADPFGVGDLGRLRDLCRWAGRRGVRIVGTLPMLATFLERPLDPSPYAPVSRLFWNELFIDVAAAPEHASAGPTAQSRGSRLVDYRRAHDAKRAALRRMAAAAARSPRRRAEIERRADERPLLRAYAGFRARRGTSAWYHLYVQHLLEEQLSILARGARRGARPGLYLDLPVGVHPAGFDAHHFRDLFVEGFSVGAPPDALFAGGQDWGFRPPHPVRAGADGHAYLRACVREHLRFARMLRVDHVAGLHRLFWVPRGGEPDAGVYVRYPARETYGVLAEEAARAGATIVGEDLGTVEPGVRRAMRRHGVLRMHVAQFEMTPARPLTRPGPGCVASLGTHDTPTCAAFLRGLDVEARVRLGHARRSAARREHAARRRLVDSLARAAHGGAESGMLRASLLSLARSRADLVLVAIEDLWLEPEPQNIPGTTTEHPNWRRRMARTVEEITSDRGLASLLRELAAARAEGGR